MTEEDIKLFTSNYIKVLHCVDNNTPYSHLNKVVDVSLKNEELSLTNLKDLHNKKSHLDKWDIFAGIILAGAITATVVGVSIATYYIVTALSNAGIIAFSSTLITSSMKEKLVNFIKSDLDWVFEQKLSDLTEQKMKEMHAKIKQFLIDHFDNDTEKMLLLTPEC
jgi:hypothetical protein